MSDEIEVTGDTPGGDTRRDALKKIGVGAAVAWSVPVIASSPAWAGASDAPFPPGYCPACGTNVVPNGQANAGTAGWSPSGGTISVIGYGGIPSVATNTPNLFALDPAGANPGDPPARIVQDFYIQDPALPNPGGCAERPAQFSFYANSVDENSRVTATIAYSVGGGPFGTPTVVGPIAGMPLLPPNPGDPSFSTVGLNATRRFCATTTIPSAAANQPILAEITFEVNAGATHIAYIDGISLIPCATC